MFLSSTESSGGQRWLEQKKMTHSRGHMSSGSDKEMILRAELSLAIDQHEQAKLDFWHIAADADGDALRLRIAASAQATAMKELYWATRRLNNFLLCQRDFGVLED
jgi:hypothetical protein